LADSAFPADAVILDAERRDTGGLEQIASVKDHRLFQACLDDAEGRALEGFPATGS